MKTKIYGILAAMALTLGATSCSEQQDEPQGGLKPMEGQYFMTMTDRSRAEAIVTNGAYTYFSFDYNGTKIPGYATFSSSQGGWNLYTQSTIPTGASGKATVCYFGSSFSTTGYSDLSVGASYPWYWDDQVEWKIIGEKMMSISATLNPQNSMLQLVSDNYYSSAWYVCWVDGGVKWDRSSDSFYYYNCGQSEYFNRYSTYVNTSVSDQDNYSYQSGLMNVDYMYDSNKTIKLKYSSYVYTPKFKADEILVDGEVAKLKVPDTSNYSDKWIRETAFEDYNSMGYLSQGNSPTVFYNNPYSLTTSDSFYFKVQMEEGATGGVKAGIKVICEWLQSSSSSSTVLDTQELTLPLDKMTVGDYYSTHVTITASKPGTTQYIRLKMQSTGGKYYVTSARIANW